MSEVGHNSDGELTPDERHALLLHYVREDASIQEEIAPLKAKRDKSRKLAKADGFQLSDLDYAIRVSKIEDADILIRDQHTRMGILEAFNIVPKGTQVDLFADRRPSDERSYAQGYADGLAGKDAPAADNQEALKGWHAGQDVMKSALQKHMEKANAQAERDEVIPSDAEDADIPE